MPLVQISQTEIDKIRREGVQEGIEKGRLEIIEWLENAYLKGSGDADPPDRNSVEAAAILKLARDAAAHFMPLVGRAGRGKRGANK